MHRSLSCTAFERDQSQRRKVGGVAPPVSRKQRAAGDGGVRTDHVRRRPCPALRSQFAILRRQGPVLTSQLIHEIFREPGQVAAHCHIESPGGNAEQRSAVCIEHDARLVVLHEANASLFCGLGRMHERADGIQNAGDGLVVSAELSLDSGLDLV